MAQITFPCPNCGATQSVDDSATSTQCQFCGNTIQVPMELRAKPAPPDPSQAAPQAYSFGGMTNMPNMAGMPAGLPGMFMNMDLTKLRAMAMAARSGDKAEAARLYGEAFGVPPDQAMQAAELMMAHHPLVLSGMQVQYGDSPMMPMGGGPRIIPAPSQGVTYNLPSPGYGGPVQRSGGSRWVGCLVVALVFGVTLLIIGGALASAFLRAR